MEFIEGKCPKCQGNLQMPQGRDKIICMYCGEEIDIEEAKALKEEELAQVQAKNNKIYEKDYQMVADGLPQLLFEMSQSLASFKKGVYEGAFRKHYMKHIVTLEAVESVYQLAEDKEEALREMALILVGHAKQQIENCPKKNAKNQLLMDYNMSLVTFTIPTILEYKGQSSDPFAERILEEWNREFKTNVGKASFEEINGGFRKKLCYITTAVCESLGKPDDCYELTLLRNYRDQYLINQEGGDEIVKEYYDIAPTIVKRINKREDHRDVYRKIWEQYLSPCIKLIEEDKNLECREVYTDMVHELEQEYLF